MSQAQLLDEETPLLTNQPQTPSQNKKQRTPLPWRQFSILLLLQVVEPLTFLVIAPFLPQLIRNIGVTDGKDSRVGYYVGLMASLFFLTEACTIFHWSRLSDKIGRKPVLLTGLFGLSLSMWSFGLSKTFWSLVLSRCLSGALNGNVGVMRSMVIEITDPTNIAQAFGILPISWAFGMTVGPLIGGSLARPTERFPEIFGGSEFLKEYPYFLPCAVPATVAVLLWLVTFFFLTETAKPQMSWKQFLLGGKASDHKSTNHQQADGAPSDGVVTETADKQLPFRALLTRRVLIAVGSYATYSLTDIAFRVILPVFYSMPIKMGGLNLDPPAIGNILALWGIAGGIIQCIVFAPMHDWLGAKNIFVVTVSLYFLIAALFPAINAAVCVHGLGPFVYFLVGFQLLLLIFSGFTYSVTFMYVGSAAPNKASIGAISGLAQMSVSFVRAFGPAVVNSAFSLSIEKNVLGGYLAYCVMAVMSGLTLWVGSFLPKKPWN